MPTNIYKEKMKKLVADSNIIPQQKKLWGILLSRSDALEDEAIYEAANSGEENLMLLSNNLHDKVLALIEGTNEAWQKVLEEEQKYLELYD
ncbi:MAG: hypothetical protein MUC28_03850 [Planctomycetes bacterium]|jgi:hypothetical protein|nr:hypothetical protein [Planctomycetota bacterium]